MQDTHTSLAFWDCIATLMRAKHSAIGGAGDTSMNFKGGDCRHSTQRAWEIGVVVFKVEERESGAAGQAQC